MSEKQNNPSEKTGCDTLATGNSFRVNKRQQVRPTSYKRKRVTRCTNVSAKIFGNYEISNPSTTRKHDTQSAISQMASQETSNCVEPQLHSSDQIESYIPAVSFQVHVHDQETSSPGISFTDTDCTHLSDTQCTKEKGNESLYVVCDMDAAENDDDNSAGDSTEEFEAEQGQTLINQLLYDIGKRNNLLSLKEENESDDENDFESDSVLEQPVAPGHNLTLKTSILLIWMYAIAHCLTSAQLGDLLTLINLHLIIAHPAYKSLHRFKSLLSKNMPPENLQKHFYCSFCMNPVSENDPVCSNAKCRKKLTMCGTKNHFVEMNIENQLKNLFSRSDFEKAVNHRHSKEKKYEMNIEDVYDSVCYKKLFENVKSTELRNVITFTFNTDGVPIFKSSKTSVWPIFLMVNELPYKMRVSREYMLLAGLWCGSSKPQMNMFLSPLHASLQKLSRGVDVFRNNALTVVKGFLLSISCDLPARSAVLNMNCHNGESACIKCFQTGSNHRTSNGGNVRIFQYSEDNANGPLRSHSNVVQDAAESARNAMVNHVRGIKGPSVLMFCPFFDCVKGVSIDYMHLLCLGLVRMLLNLWFNVKHATSDFSISKFVAIVDDRLENLKMPHFILRQPRSITEHLKFWKATELRAWFFYYSIPCISDLLRPSYLYHYCALVEGLYLLCQSSISPDDIAKSEKLLKYFVFMLPSLYGERFMTLNAHSLLHLPQTVKELGPLWCNSCFAFEGANGELLKLFHGTQAIDLQIANAVHIYQLLPTLVNSIKKSSIAYNFVNSLSRFSLEEPDGCADGEHVFLGKKYQQNIPLSVEVKLAQACGCRIEDLSISFYKRAKLNGVVFHSLAYTRVVKRNSYSVKFIQGQVEFYGFINWFAECFVEGRFVRVACIEKLQEYRRNLFTDIHPDMTPSPLISQNFMDIKLPHLHFFKANNGSELVVVNVTDIIQMCVCLHVDEQIIFCEEPNRCERNL